MLCWLTKGLSSINSQLCYSSGSVLLVFYICRVNSSDGNLALRRTFPIKQRGQLIRSAFCPLMSFSQGACIGKAGSKHQQSSCHLEVCAGLPM